MIPSFKRLKLADRVLQQLQSNVAAVLDAIGVTGSILNGQLITYTAARLVAAGSALNLGHSLGRVPFGILFLLSKTGSFSSYPAFVVLKSTASVVTVKCSQAVEAGGSFSLWVF